MEATGLLVIMSFSWVASHLPRPTTKKKYLFKFQDTMYITFPLEVCLPYWYSTKEKTQFLSHNLKPVRSLLVYLLRITTMVTQKIGRQLRTW